MLLQKQFRFEASHRLPLHPGKCSRLHGHSWVLLVEVSGEPNPLTGFVLDYGDISAQVKPIVEALDHKHLGQYNKIPLIPDEWKVPGIPCAFNPTSENLLIWIAGQIGLEFPWSRLTLEETCTSQASLDRFEYLRMRDNSSVRSAGSSSQP